MKNRKAPYQIIPRSAATRPRHLRYSVVEGTGGLTRTEVSRHRKLSAAERAASKWRAPAAVTIVDRQTGEEM